MSLESIYRVISNAQKAAAVQNTGTADEKAALDVLGGLTALLEARLRLHKHDAAPAAVSSPNAAAVKPPAPAVPTKQDHPTAASAAKKHRTASDESYDLK